ncbi:MAG: molecular chaperone TorD family protein [Myxococcus sp.]|nr:molecular chaperone TorD family protein [Myxococcus sp.]
MNAEVLEDRALSFALAATVSGYPTTTFHQRLETLVSMQPVGWAAPLLEGSATQAGLERLQSDFIANFEVGSARLPLHETEFGRTKGLSKGTDLADLAGFYRAFNLELSDVEGDHEVFDHLAVELEFYSSLLAREAWLAETGNTEGVEVVREARGKFLEAHLGRLATALRAHAQLNEGSPWQPALAWTVELVLAECRAVGVTPPALDGLSSAEPDEVACAVNLNPPGGKARS